MKKMQMQDFHKELCNLEAFPKSTKECSDLERLPKMNKLSAPDVGGNHQPMPAGVLANIPLLMELQKGKLNDQRIAAHLTMPEATIRLWLRNNSVASVRNIETLRMDSLGQKKDRQNLRLKARRGSEKQNRNSFSSNNIALGI